ncbi:MAG: hypothetical protein HY650_14035, partial [Acidobacteria bacterium]|nr:hypothetical protein [Acidobacteriota bacterium]
MAWALAFGVLAVYVALPTRNYYWDGISFALKIEEATELNPSMFHPNHLLYTPAGYLLHRFNHGLGLNLRALETLQTFNSVLSALSAYLLFRILAISTGNSYLSSSLTLLFAFSATWWKFSTDANAYIPSVFCLLICCSLILPAKRPRPLLLAVAHASAMVLHQLAALMYPVLLLGLLQQSASFGLRRKLWLLWEYSAVACIITLSIYYYGFMVSHGRSGMVAFVQWVISYDPSAPTAFDFYDSLTASLQGQVRLLLGGRLALALSSARALTMGVIVVLSVLVAYLGASSIRNFRSIRALFSGDLNRNRDSRLLMRLAGLWIG